MAIEPKSSLVTRTRAEDVVYRMFELHMDDYLSEEGEYAREILEAVCREWDDKVRGRSEDLRVQCR
jgi:recyclin-1